MSTRCIVCDSEMEFYFSKKFNYSNLKTVDYNKCVNCGLTVSKTHYDMSQKDWETLNFDFHSQHNLREDNPFNRNQRYFYQAEMIYLMNKFNLFNEGSFLDWGSGVGSVSAVANNIFNIDILNFDKYIAPQLKKVKEEELKPRDYALVMCNGVFEHVRDRQTLNKIESYVSQNGCLGFHTLVPENIPKDSNWMYLLPVHCTFHTNKSMSILMKQWGYTCSVYNEHSKMWILFKKEPHEIVPHVEKLNHIMGWEYLKYKKGFMNYWK